MAMTLLEKAQQVLEEKRTKVIPENIKDDITIFGVEGILEAGKRANVKCFTSFEEMNNDPDKQEGDLAFIYNRKVFPFTEESTATKFTFPKEVHLDAKVPHTVQMTFTCGSFDGYACLTEYSPCTVSLYKTSYDMDTGEETRTNYFYAKWTTSDYQNFTLTQYTTQFENLTGDAITEDKVYDFGAPFTDTNLGNIYATLEGLAYFILEDKGMFFEGLYRCNANGEYEIADNQFTTTSSEVLAGMSFFGANGVQDGTLGIDAVSATFDDASANIYSLIQKQYDNLNIVGTNGNATGGMPKEITFIPNKSNGQSVLDTSNVTNMDEAFYRFGQLTVAPNINTSNATTMVEMFAWCENLTSVPLYDTSKVTSMYQMFNRCESLVEVPNFNTSKVTNMYGTFGVTGLVRAPEIDMSKVTTAFRMFQSCGDLQYVPVYDWSSLTNPSQMFSFCSSLTDESLNNIMASVLTCPSATKTLKNIGLTKAQATKCQSLSNYQAMLDAGWTTGY